MSRNAKEFQRTMMSKYREEYRDDIAEVHFFGEPIEDASREELLGLIGWMVHERQSSEATLASERRMWSVLRR